MNKLYILVLLAFAALLLASCSAGLTFTSDDGTVGITGYDGNNTIDFSALSGGTGCDQSIGNITAPTGSVGIIACNETIILTSDDASVTIRAWDGNNTIDFAAAGLGGGCADVFRVINPPAGTDPTAQGCNDILNLTASLGNITITGNGITSTVDFTLNPSVTIDAEWNSIAKLEAIYGVQLWTSADGTLADDSVSLADVQAACVNDFHTIGGTDDDVPELGDFGAANDLDANGDVDNDSHDHTTLTISGLDISADTNLAANSGCTLTDDTISAVLGTTIETGEITDSTILEADLDIDNAAVDEYALTYEASSGKFSWETRGLDRQYELGQTITADVADLVTTLNAANIDFTINMASTGDVIIQDGGTAVHYWDDSATYRQVINNTNAPNGGMYLAGTVTTDGWMSAVGWNCIFTRDAGSGKAYAGFSTRGINQDLNESTDFSSGSGYHNIYGGEFHGDMDSAFSGTATQLADLNVVAGLFGGATASGARSTSGTINQKVYGLQFAATNSGAFSTGTATDTIAGVDVVATNSVAYSSGTYSANTYGIKASGQGGTGGTQSSYGGHFTGTFADTSYGIYATAASGTDNYAAYFERNLADTVPVVYILQDNTGGQGACLELKQDDTDEPFIDFTGTSSADASPTFTTRIIVELNGTDYYLYLDPV